MDQVGSRSHKLIDTQERSTTPNGDPPRKIIDFATSYRSSGIQGRNKDFASGYGFIHIECEDLDKNGLQGKYRILEPPDESYDCHDLAFFNGRHRNLSEHDFHTIINHFKFLGNKKKFQKNPLLYQDLSDKLSRNKDSCVVLYFRGKAWVHSSPIEEVYQKENGEYSIRLFGKWGKGALISHDIEDVPSQYRDDDNNANWLIAYNEEVNGRILDLS